MAVGPSKPPRRAFAASHRGIVTEFRVPGLSFPHDVEAMLPYSELMPRSLLGQKIGLFIPSGLIGYDLVLDKRGSPNALGGSHLEEVQGFSLIYRKATLPLCVCPVMIGSRTGPPFPLLPRQMRVGPFLSSYLAIAESSS